MIKISPYGKTISDEEMIDIFRVYSAHRESLFRRYEMNEVIEFTKGIGIDVGCGLNKIHSAAIGIDLKLSEIDYGYPFGAQIRGDGGSLPLFKDNSLDFVFSSHCLEHFYNPKEVLIEWIRVLKRGRYLVLILPDKKYYPNVGSPNANKKHKHDFLPSDLERMLNEIGGVKIVQIDTIHAKLEGNPLAITEAKKYGHQTLNFSFEVVAVKQ